SKYQLAESPERAVLVTDVDYTGKSIGWVALQAFRDEQCGKEPSGTRIADFVSSGRLAPLHGLETPIPANRLFVFTFHYSLGVETMGGKTTCLVTTAFTPVSGKRYGASFDLQANTCSVSLVDLG